MQGAKGLADRLMRRGNNGANRGGRREEGVPAWHGRQGLE